MRKIAQVFARNVGHNPNKKVFYARFWDYEAEKYHQTFSIAKLQILLGDYSGKIITSRRTAEKIAQEAYYKGKQMGWYMLFDEIVDYEGVVQEKMEEPLIVYSNGAQGVTINGQKYNKVKNG